MVRPLISPKRPVTGGHDARHHSDGTHGNGATKRAYVLGVCANCANRRHYHEPRAGHPCGEPDAKHPGIAEGEDADAQSITMTRLAAGMRKMEADMLATLVVAAWALALAVVACALVVLPDTNSDQTRDMSRED
jgi:hypothetical protein